MVTRRFRVLEFFAIALIIFLGIGLRINEIDSRPLWGDEAESSINALTILERGYPSYKYLGLPIYENTLITSWPESAEYEFKDLSYSDCGMAIYHGWLPLYSIAASFAAFGITPDTIADPSTFRQDPAEFKMRTIAARAPSIVFSILTMIFMYLAGRLLYGFDGGLAALVWSAFGYTFIFFGWQARYYSATLAFNACAAVAIILSIQKGKWRHFVFVGFTLVCLFHTHILSFLVALIVFVLSFFKWRRHLSALPKCCLTFFIIGAATLPWILFTGFLTSLGRMPGAWRLLILPQDLLFFLQKDYILSGLVFLVTIAAVFCLQRKLPIRIRKPLLSSRRKALFFLFWSVLSIVSFYVLIPAPSFFLKRMALSILVPASLLAIICLVAVTKVIFSRGSIFVAPISILLVLFITGQLKLWEKESILEPHDYAPCKILSEMDIQRNTRFYATPSDQLVLTFYTGLPVQSVAPVRKEFLESYEGDIVLISNSRMAIKETDPIGALSLMEAAKKTQTHLSETDAKALSDQLAKQLIWEELMRADSAIISPQRGGRESKEDMLLEQRQLNGVRLENWKKNISQSPLFRGFDIQHFADFWQIFFYRFVDPDSRRGSKLNYLNRFRNAKIYVDPKWVVRVSPN